MNKVVGLFLAISGLFSVAHADNEKLAAKWYITCYVNEKSSTVSKSYKIDGQSLVKQQAQLTSYMSFAAYDRIKTQVTSTTPWMKLGDHEVVINIFYKGYPLTDSTGKENAVSITRLDGVTLTVGCYAYKK